MYLVNKCWRISTYSFCRLITNVNFPSSKEHVTYLRIHRSLTVPRHEQHKSWSDSLMTHVARYRPFVSFWPVQFSSVRLRASQLYSGGDSRLADQTERTPCPWLPAHRVGPSSSSVCFFTGQQLANDLSHILYTCVYIFSSNLDASHKASLLMGHSQSQSLSLSLLVHLTSLSTAKTKAPGRWNNWRLTQNLPTQKHRNSTQSTTTFHQFIPHP
jgi:hypothetical protein